MKFSNHLSHGDARVASKKSLSASTATLASRRLGVASWGLLLLLCHLTLSSDSPPAGEDNSLPGSPKSSPSPGGNSSSFTLDSECEQQTANLSLQIDYKSHYDEVNPVCTQTNASDQVCTYEYLGYTMQVKTLCITLGGKLYVYKESLKCDDNKTGGTTSIYKNDWGTCIGTNCSKSYLESTLQLGLAGSADEYAHLGLTNCNTTIGSVELLLTVGGFSIDNDGNESLSPSSGGGSNSSLAPSGGKNSPAPSSGNNSPAPSTGNNSPSLSPVTPASSPAGSTPSPSSGGNVSGSLSVEEECQAKTNTLNPINDDSLVVSSCTTSGCTYDWANFTAHKEPRCTAIGGEIFIFSSQASCDNAITNMTAYIRTINFGLCYGAGCSLSNGGIGTLQGARQ